MSSKSNRSIDDLLSPREHELWRAIKKLGEFALSAVGNEIEAATGLSGADFGVLSRLEDLGGGRLGQKELALSLGWDKSRLSHHLTRMEGRRLLRRDPLTSGRGMTIGILSSGRRAIAVARPVHAIAVRKHILQFISPAEGQALLVLAGHLNPAV